MGETSSNLHSFQQSKQFFEPKQYFSVHGSTPITTRVNKETLLANMLKKNQNSSLNVIGRKNKTNDSPKTVEHHPYSHSNFKQVSTYTGQQRNEDELHKDTSLDSFATSKDLQFAHGRGKQNLTSRQTNMNNG